MRRPNFFVAESRVSDSIQHTKINCAISAMFNNSRYAFVMRIPHNTTFISKGKRLKNQLFLGRVWIHVDYLMNKE